MTNTVDTDQVFCAYTNLLHFPLVSGSYESVSVFGPQTLGPSMWCRVKVMKMLGFVMTCHQLLVQNWPSVRDSQSKNEKKNVTVVCQGI